MALRKFREKREYYYYLKHIVIK